ncbi:L-aspartate oxidase [Porticoccus litoralis]|uniref:L-aspartate oxidase n=1 Tax=Porticoccus litoralis TaxID=434086 RepID=A0AAW8B3W6_9GAMM|nr:L-aspartate oxidase [Porticoccus litoralis]MDP1521271.1 L-aspartate oxidase [Porticoccus litoralis]
MKKTHHHDVLVVGSGAAGMTVALQLADKYRIALLSKSALKSGSTWYAQGGIAAVFDNEDSIESHVQDTLIAGAGLCHEDTVRYTVEQGPEAIRWLVQQGVKFTLNSDNDDYHLTQEGGHSHRRILHTADATGREVSSSLADQVLQHPSIDVYEDHTVVDLITQADSNSSRVRCTGAYVLDDGNDCVCVFQAKVVVLATGGASKAYLYTTNPDGASGDGIAVAWRRGCRVANMEFNQFHPTCLYHPSAKAFLITEALRGEGAQLKLPNGERFMDKFHPSGELAPRDIVARAIDHEMKRLGSDCLFLDISHRSEEFLESHFPTIKAKCLSYGIDITREPIPVVPAAHYTCGGIMVNKSGQTDLWNLYAIGETAFTGLHGANRMASNSLVECVVYGQAAAQAIRDSIENIDEPEPARAWDESRVTHSDEDVVISHNWDELRRFMWDYVGIVRTRKRLERAHHRVKLLQKEIQEYYTNYKISRDLLELRNLVLVADLIIRSAEQRTESRGLHYTLDYPKTSDIAKDTIMVPINFAAQNVIVRKN